LCRPKSGGIARKALALLHDTREWETPAANSTAEDLLPAAALFVVSDDAQAILTEFRQSPVTSRQERILRTIASKYYQRGYCFARHTTIATAVGCAKSTLQLDLDELEARGLLAVQRRPKTSNVTILAPGLIEALRIMRLERRRAEFVSRRGVSRVLNRVESYKKIATAAMEELATFARDTVAVAAAKISEFTAPKAVLSVPVLEKKPAQDFDFSLNRPKAVSQPGTLSPKFISAKASPDAKKEKTTGKLREAGVSPRQARELIKTFGVERAERNLALGLHLNAMNPGGYLATAIRENYAANRLHPDSEAVAVRRRERPEKVVRERFDVQTAQVAKPASMPLPKSAIEAIASAFDHLPTEERAVYEQQARESVAAAPPTWLVSILQRCGFEHPAVRGAIKVKALESWQRLAAAQTGG